MERFWLSLKLLDISHLNYEIGRYFLPRILCLLLKIQLGLITDMSRSIQASRRPQKTARDSATPFSLQRAPKFSRLGSRWNFDENEPWQKFDDPFRPNTGVLYRLFRVRNCSPWEFHNGEENELAVFAFTHSS